MAFSSQKNPFCRVNDSFVDRLVNQYKGHVTLLKHQNIKYIHSKKEPNTGRIKHLKSQNSTSITGARDVQIGQVTLR